MAVNLERFISNACCNSCQSFYDHYVEANVKFRSSLGMKAVIIRRQLGNCCDWCAKLAGIYTPYNAPDDIYRRHNNCRCLVTYKTETGYQDVWTKKVFQTQKESRIERLNIIDQENKRLEPFEMKKRKLLSEGKHVYDATNEWEVTSEPETATWGDLKIIRMNGSKYTVNGVTIILDLKQYEKDTLVAFVKKYGGTLQYHPRVIDPPNVKCPDCLFNGIRYDLKTLGLKNPGCRGKNLMLHAIQDNERQAHCFIFDISRSGLTKEEAIDQAERLFYRKMSSFIHTAVLYDGKDFFKILTRI